MNPLANVIQLYQQMMTRGQGKLSALPLEIAKVGSFADYLVYSRKQRQGAAIDFSFEKALLPSAPAQFSIPGFCFVCNAHVDFLVDFDFAYVVDDVLMPNWRERLECPICRFNNRMRAAIHLFYLQCKPKPRASVYLTEQMTALYRYFKDKFPNAYGSEYLGNGVDFGACNADGVRNEDLTRLSFLSNQFDFILSFDVLEHIQNFRQALAECYRCLKPGGSFMFTVPFEQDSKANIVRAKRSPTGDIVHLLPPEYHGDPMNPEGCLCYYHFGWELLEDLKAVGFTNSQAILYWSSAYGYLGGEQLIFLARK